MIDRRKLLQLGVLGPAGLALGCGDNQAGEEGSLDLDASMLDCVLTPEQTAGPFYFDPAMERSDIVEDRVGTHLELMLEIVAASNCEQLVGTRVDIWHCDAEGLYSGYPGQGDNQDVDTSGLTFLRGTQLTDTSGNVTFATIYPGWYPGRAVHIHFRVFDGAQAAATGQLYFDDALTDAVFSDAPYAARGPRDRTNETDGIAGDPESSGTLASLVTGDGGYRGSLRIGIA